MLYINNIDLKKYLDVAKLTIIEKNFFVVFYQKGRGRNKENNES